MRWAPRHRDHPNEEWRASQDEGHKMDLLAQKLPCRLRLMEAGLFNFTAEDRGVPWLPCTSSFLCGEHCWLKGSLTSQRRVRQNPISASPCQTNGASVFLRLQNKALRAERFSQTQAAIIVAAHWSQHGGALSPAVPRWLGPAARSRARAGPPGRIWPPQEVSCR